MRPFPIFAILFFIIPLIEIYLLVKVGEHIGALKTIFLVVLTAVIGAFLLRQQGLSTFGNFQRNLSTGRVPALEIIEGLLLLVGGVLLMTPGFFTDALGFLCLLPFTRRLLAKRLMDKAAMHVSASSVDYTGAHYQNRGDVHVYEGEYEKSRDEPLEHHKSK